MFIKFNEGFNSYDEGSGEPFLKENEPFEVNQVEGDRLLEVKGAQFEKDEKGKRQMKSVPVFVKVEPKTSQLPEDFPFRKELADNKIFGMEQLAPMSLEEIGGLEKIGEVKAKAIFDAKEKIKGVNQ